MYSCESYYTTSLGGGDDILIAGSGTGYFDCGEGPDVVIDFNISENDDNTGDCEEIMGVD